MLSACLPAYKPQGMRSSHLVALVKKNLKVKKIGHAGTLDSFAEGVMLLLIGSATALSNVCMAQRKSYHAMLRFGVTTDTLDPYGTPKYSKMYPSVYQVLRAIQAERGALMQRPPRFSALKFHGKRYSDLARQGIFVEPPKRKIHIYSAVPVQIQRKYAEVKLTTSKGTYIRSYAQSLAEHWEGLAYLHALRRESIGGIHYSQAYPISAVQHDARYLATALKPISWLLKRLTLHRISLSETGKNALIQRKELHASDIVDGESLCKEREIDGTTGGSSREYIAEAENICAVIRVQGGRIRYHVLDMFPKL